VIFSAKSKGVFGVLAILAVLSVVGLFTVSALTSKQTRVITLEQLPKDISREAVPVSDKVKNLSPSESGKHYHP
jgi:hypothetical protein